MQVYYSPFKTLRELVDARIIDRYKTSDDIAIASFGMIFSLLEGGGMIVEDDTSIEDIAEYMAALFEADKAGMVQAIEGMMEDGYLLKRDYLESDGSFEYTEVVDTDKDGKVKVYGYRCNGAA